MNVVSTNEVDALLMPAGLKVGPWGGIAADDESVFSLASFMPSDNALALYATSMSLSAWFGAGRLVVIRADNSTCPLEDEHAVFRGLLGGVADDWLHSESRSLAYRGHGDGDVWMETARFALLIHFWILFQWHVHVVLIHEDRILRLAIEEGVVSLRAKGPVDPGVDAVVQKILDDPLGI